LIQDFIWGHYGPAAPALADYEALLAETREKNAATMATPAGGIRYPMDVPFLSKDFLDKATVIFKRAEGLANGDEGLQRRVERAELPILYVKCVRGPEFFGDAYAAAVEKFEKVARREQVTMLQESAADFEQKLAEWKARIPKADEPAPK
jgi:hypothetical protein